MTALAARAQAPVHSHEHAHSAVPDGSGSLCIDSVSVWVFTAGYREDRCDPRHADRTTALRSLNVHSWVGSIPANRGGLATTADARGPIAELTARALLSERSHHGLLADRRR